MRQREETIELKSIDEFLLMRQAGLVVARGLAAMREAAVVGTSTLELDSIARKVLKDAGATSSFLGYHGYPAVICASINDRVVHGIPAAGDVLKDGDNISLDFGAIVEGWNGDAAITVQVGSVSPEVARLSQVCEASLWAGLGAARAGGRLSDISYAVERSVRGAGRYGIVTGYGGHGIGSQMHMDPHVPNHGKPGRGPRLEPGMALAIEPMITLGRAATRILADDWTVVTHDGSAAAHWEHTVAILDDGPWVLTAEDGGRSHLAVSAAAGA